MIWIILALTLGASITSIIHGVFMLFGSLSITGTAIPGIPSTMLAVLPIISAIFALIGGIIAFNQSKWGSVFLLIATGLCAPARDTWLYGGLYFFAGLLCFFLSGRKQDEYQDLYDDEYADSEPEDYPQDYDANAAQDFYYMPEPEQFQPQPQVNPDLGLIGADVAPQPNNEPPKVRRRMSKSCPECGAVVSRDAFYCPTCGAKLFVVSDNLDAGGYSSPVLEHEPLEDQEDIQEVNNQLFASSGADSLNDFPDNEEYINDDNTMPQNQAGQNFRASVSPIRQEVSRGMAVKRTNSTSAKQAASTYADFSRYASKGKKRRKSASKKILSILVLVGAVGGALYFLLGLRKLPPGDLPPMVRTEVVNAADSSAGTQIPVSTTPAAPSQTTPAPRETVAQPEVAVAENMLPNFTPDRTPKNGSIIGSNVNVRADHSTSSSRVTRLNVGTRVEVLGTFNVPSGQYSGTWYNIATGGREGWVYGRYLQPLGSGIPSGYSNGLLRSFGSTRSQMIESLGNPTRSTSSSVEWRGLTATVRGEDVTRLRLTNSSRELQNGLKVGMSQDTLRQIMGYPSSVNGRTLNYNENGKTGLSIQLDSKNVISTITVNEVQ